jgi:hypothetical protein
VRELFVWYRVAESRASTAQGAVLAMQHALMAEHPGLAARLLVRRDGPAGAQTWMETYANTSAPEGVGPALERSIEARATLLAAVHDGPRHVEAFEPVRG